jgi:hypothetical protein
MKIKKRISRLTEAELNAYPIKGIVEGWYFRIEEVSQGYFRVTGMDEWGRSISRDGIDPDELLLACKKDIVDISSDE